MRDFHIDDLPPDDPPAYTKAEVNLLSLFVALGLLAPLLIFAAWKWLLAGPEPAPSSGAANRKRAGASMLEAAVCWTIVGLIMVLLVSLGYAVQARNTVAHCARETSRWASLRPQATDAQIVAFALANAPGLDTTRLTVTVYRQPPSEVVSTNGQVMPVNGIVKLTVSYALGNGISLASTSEDVIAYSWSTTGQAPKPNPWP